jgi:hypothetical protein
MGFRVACILGLAVCGFVLLVHYFFGGIACSFDTSYCAMTRHKDGLYRGVLRDRQGNVLADTPFTVRFESRRNERRRDVGGFRSDGQGRFCIVWPSEEITPFIELDGTDAIHTPWVSLGRQAPPPGCQPGDAGIPWNRSDDLESTIQFRSVPALLVPAAALLVLAFLFRMEGAGKLLQRGGLALTAAGTVLAAVLWFG